MTDKESSPIVHVITLERTPERREAYLKKNSHINSVFCKAIDGKKINVEEYINKNRAFGELGHPDTPSINLDRVSHLIVGLHQEGNAWIGKAKILETPMGNIARSLIEGGAQLGVSSRGMGSLKMENGINVVQGDFCLATAADIVADPSAPGAFVQGIMEGKEWMMINGNWTEVQLEEAKQEIRQASKKQIEQVSLKIFENFIKKL
jgi:hypothetical protein